MVTVNQVVNKIRKKKHHFVKSKRLENQPFKSGTVMQLAIVKPKKPNSARRKIAFVYTNRHGPKWSKGRKVYRRKGRYKYLCYISGIGHNLKRYSKVNIRGGRVPDLPGIKYHIVKGVKDFTYEEQFERANRRSKFGRKKNMAQY